MPGQILHQLHVGSSMPKDWGGIERYIVYVTTEMVNRGHQVTVTAPKNSPLSNRLTATQIPARLLHKYDPLILAKYLRILKTQKPDILITHFSPDYIMPAYAARLTQTRTCMTRHVTAHFKPSRTKLYEKLYDGYVAISRAVQDHLIEDGIPKGKVHLAYNGSPPLIPTGTVELQSPSIAVFGRLVWVKGQDIAIRTLEDLPGVHLHLFGDGPFRGELQLLSQALNVSDRTHFHGHINDVANAMQSADVVLIPSIWREAFGFTAVEAMSLGKPIVANNYGGLSEIFTHDKTALLFTSTDPESPDPKVVAQLIKSLLDNPSKAEKLGIAAKAYYEANFTVELMADRLEVAYSKIAHK
ncbi:MAG: glycosyltransferase family 4 protein [Fimbriimonadaceae bacterium]